MDVFTKLNDYSKKFNKNWNLYVKKNTDTAFRIMLDYGDKNNKGNYPLKIEISSRNRKSLIEGNLDYTKISDVNVYNLNEIISMKAIAFNSGDKIRDFYDLSYYLEKNPELFSYHDLKLIKVKLDYTDMDILCKLLEHEFNSNKLKEINAEKLVLNTYDIVQSLFYKLEKEYKNKKNY